MLTRSQWIAARHDGAEDIHEEQAKRYMQALCREQRIRKLGLAGKKIFIEQAIELFNFARYEDWKYLNHTSFDEWAASPDNHVSRSAATDGRQAIDLFCRVFWIPAAELEKVGWKKLKTIMPVVEKIREAVRPEWMDDIPAKIRATYQKERMGYLCPEAQQKLKQRLTYQQYALYWVKTAQSLSDTKLKEELDYRLKGWETTFSGPVEMAKLRQIGYEKGIDALLSFMGLADLPDDQKVVGNWKYQIPPKDQAVEKEEEDEQEEL